jgi:biotin operon repressor
MPVPQPKSTGLYTKSLITSERKEIQNQTGNLESLGCPIEVVNCEYYSLPRTSEGKILSGPRQ